LFYRYGNRLLVVKVEMDGDSISFGDPELIYDQEFHNVSDLSFDVAPDGRILILESAERPDDIEHIHIMSPGWLDQLE
jgi:hypothetical protein